MPAQALVALGIASALGLLGLFGLARTRGHTRAFVSLLVGGAGIYEGIVLLPMLWHGLALTAIAPGLERTAVTLAFAGGAATCLLYLFVEVSEPGLR